MRLLLHSEFTGRSTHNTLEVAPEVALIGKTQFASDRSNRLAGPGPKQFSSARYAELQLVLVRWEACRAFELTRKMKG